MSKKVKPKRKPVQMCDPAVCDFCQYIGEGDFICDKYIDDPDRVVVVEDWSPTENFLQCKKEET